ncbi:MAG: UDP-3-O-(3-hydroxymyristoyl)glucosamine N-acyltransferase [Gemmatimonadales bacterium]
MTAELSKSVATGGERAGTLTARAIADIVGGELRGAPDTIVRSVAPLSRAERDQLSFLSDRRYSAALESSSAGVVLITKELAETPGNVASRIVVDKPQAALLELLSRFYPPVSQTPSVHPTARIGRGARIGRQVTLDAYAVIGDGAVVSDNVWLGAHCVIGDGVIIGAETRLFPHVTLYSGSEIGSRVRLHSGVRIGSDGFGYVFSGTEHSKIPHVGRCIVGDDVEIGANTTIDRGSIDDTTIGAGTKIDNLVQVGHNVKIGKLCLIMAQVGIAGSAQIGDGCVLAGQAGLGGHITIGPGARIGGQSGVFGDVPAGETWSGYPARPHRESLRATGALFKIAGMMKRLEKLLDDHESEKS